jgi:hypothetical protein
MAHFRAQMARYYLLDSFSFKLILESAKKEILY